MAKVSICIPAYNDSARVKRLLASVEIQTFQDYEVIITDDSETDGIKTLVESREKVFYYKNEKRLGSTANWNEAIKKSHGEYIKLMHHDDWFTDKDSLQEFVDLLDRHPEAALAFCGTVQAQEDGSFIRHIRKEDAKEIEADFRNVFLGNTIGSPSAVIVRRHKDGEGGDGPLYEQALTWLVDMEYYMRILKDAPQLVYTEKPLVSMGIGESQLTERCRDDRELNAREYGFIYDKYHLETQKKYREKLGRILAEAGKSAAEAKSHGIGRVEYDRIRAGKLFSAVWWKLTHLLADRRFWAFFAVLLFAVSMIPVFALANYNYATGDDFWNGRMTHQAWLNTHSLFEVIKAAGRSVAYYYETWQGTWLSLFLFSLQPEVFSPDGYVIVAWLMVGVFCITTGILAWYVLVRMAGYEKSVYIILAVLYVTAAFQFLFSPRAGIFWWTGTVHYVIPYGMAMLGIFFFLRFMEERKASRWCYAGLLTVMGLLGGTNYQAALLVPVVALLLIPVYWFKGKKKRVAACFLPFVLEAAGLLVSMRAPGNRVRGGEDFSFSVGRAGMTVLRSFVAGAREAGKYLSMYPLLIVFFLLAAVFIWHMLRRQEVKKRYSCPALFLAGSYCVYCAMFAPAIYANVYVSGGYHNTNFYVFLLMVFADLVYVEGYLAGRLEERRSTERKAVFAVLALIAVLTVAFRSNIKDSTFYLCVDYIRSGRAADYKRQMEEQRAILFDPQIRDAVVAEINDDQGPLMHMPVTGDPMAWSNTGVGYFYGKDSVVAIPRAEWNERQAQKKEKP